MSTSRRARPHAAAEALPDVDQKRPDIETAGIKTLRGIPLMTPPHAVELRVEQAALRYLHLLDALPLGVYTASADGRITSANKALADLLGYPDRRHLIGLDERQIYVDWPTRRGVSREGGRETADVRCRRRDGSGFDARRTILVSDHSGSDPLERQVLLEDITARAADRHAYRVVDQQFRRLTAESIVGSVTIQSGRIVYANARFQSVFGWTASAAVAAGRFVDAVVADGDQERVLRFFATRSPLRQQSATLEFDAKRGDGTIFNVEMEVSHTEFGGAPALLGTLVDTVRRRQIEQMLLHSGLQDSLTGLANRSLFLERLEHSVLRRARGDYPLSYAVLFLDLDRFKAINDSLGHQVGDELLIEAAHRLQRCVRPADTVARFGGDEFAVLLEDVEDITHASRVAERILREIARPMELRGYHVTTGASIGIVLSGAGEERVDRLIDRADMAMYRAKAAGRGRYEIFDRAMHANTVARLTLEGELRSALDAEEFRLLYQPILDLGSGQLRGFEALVHWDHPRRGLLSPGEFIVLAEDTGVILQLSEWILRQACEQIRDWQVGFAGDAPLTMSINLSMRQLLQSDLADQIETVMKDVGVPAESLRFDITELAITSNLTAASAALSRMRALGLELCLDDFGTGSSSLNYLHKLPLNTLKIDCSLVGRLGGDHPDSHLVRTIVNVARDFGMRVVSEGIETREHLDVLRRLGCQMGQGYLFSRAVDAAGATRFMIRPPPWQEHWAKK